VKSFGVALAAFGVMASVVLILSGRADDRDRKAGGSRSERTCWALYDAARNASDSLRVDTSRPFWNDQLCVVYRMERNRKDGTT